MSHAPLTDESFQGDLLAERYRLGPRLGRGGQGTTHLALDTATGDRVAIKTFDLSRIEEWKELELFERECRVLSELDHPGIPRFLDQIRDEEQGRYHLVMAHVEGKPLREIVRENGPLGEDALWDVLFQTLDVLGYLHRRVPPVIHRDIKPSNLIQGSGGELSVVDFGGVRESLREEGGSTVVGTFGFMAPEQLHGQALPATDLFALGATLIHLGTGIDPEKLPRKGLRIDFADKLAVSDDLKKLLRRLTEPDPEKRPASAVTLLEELESGTASPADYEEEAPVAEPLPPQPPPVPTDLPWPMAFALGVLLTVVSVAGRMALGVAEYILIPLVFILLQTFSNKPELMRQREQETKETARRWRVALRDMAQRGKRDLREARRWAKSEERRLRRKDPEVRARVADLQRHRERVRAQRRHWERRQQRTRPQKAQKRQYFRGVNR